MGQRVLVKSSKYPVFLKEISDFPKKLYIEGPLQRVDWEKTVSIVGTRRPTSYGTEVAKKLGSELGSIGISVISGLAYGIDRTSQLACAFAGGYTIGVLGEGIGSWKRRNQSLANQFKGKLILISEYEPDYPAQNFTFPQRNRIIAGLSLRTVIVEAPEVSGALITAKLAEQYDRDVFAVPHRIDNVRGIGGNNLIANFQAKIFRGIGDFVDSGYIKKMRSRNVLRTASGQHCREVINIIEKSPELFATQIAAKLNTTMTRLMPMLTKLETEGILTRTIDGKYSTII